MPPRVPVLGAGAGGINVEGDVERRTSTADIVVIVGVGGELGENEERKRDPGRGGKRRNIRLQRCALSKFRSGLGSALAGPRPPHRACSLEPPPNSNRIKSRAQLRALRVLVRGGRRSFDAFYTPQDAYSSLALFLIGIRLPATSEF